VYMLGGAVITKAIEFFTDINNRGGLIWNLNFMYLIMILMDNE
jgi:hypothetical protein